MDESAIAEMMGAIVLISVFVLAIAIMQAVLPSYIIPKKYPHITFSVQPNSSNSSLIQVIHDGGDTLFQGEYSIRVSGSEVSFPNSSMDFKTGEIREFNSDPYLGEKIVYVIYKYSGGSDVLFSKKF